MDKHRAVLVERVILTFGVDGLHAHEERLFTSFVRLLNNHTEHQWQHRPSASNAKIDLLVVAEGPLQPSSQNPDRPRPSVLRVGTNRLSSSNGPGFLCWPVNPDALLQELNRLGALIVSQWNAAPEPPLHVLHGNPTPLQLVSNTRLVRLRQWPPTHLLTGTGTLRMATLLTGKAMTLAELARRSAMPLPVCDAFVDALLRANLIVEASAANDAKPPLNAPVQKVVKRGLLASIRMRLGISA